MNFRPTSELHEVKLAVREVRGLQYRPIKLNDVTRMEYKSYLNHFDLKTFLQSLRKSYLI